MPNVGSTLTDIINSNRNNLKSALDGADPLPDGGVPTSLVLSMVASGNSLLTVAVRGGVWDESTKLDYLIIVANEIIIHVNLTEQQRLIVQQHYDYVEELHP